jgi:hypothetical protein
VQRKQRREEVDAAEGASASAVAPGRMTSIARRAPQTQRAPRRPVQVGGSGAPLAAVDGAPAVLLVDDGAIQPGQMLKRQFVALLRAQIIAAADHELGPIYAGLGCPYIERAFARHAARSAAEIEALLLRFAPAARSARTAADLIPAVLERVCVGVRAWRDRGEVPADVGGVEDIEDVDPIEAPEGKDGAAPAPGPRPGDPPAAGVAAATPAAKELGANQRVLARDAAHTTDAYVPKFRDRLGSKITGWDLPFDPAAVTLDTVTIDGVPTRAMLLDWNAAWGPLPAARDLPLTMTPADARAAVTACATLGGWSKLAAGDQSILTNLLGGEQNYLSEAVREHLRPGFKTLKGKRDDDQAAGLKAAMTVKDAMPNWIIDEMETAAATVTLAGPTTVENYAFTGTKADGEQWTAAFSDGVSTPIVAPKAPTDGYHNHSVKEMADSACYLPKTARQQITVIVLNPVVNPADAHWAAEYNRPDFHSYMTAGAAGVVTVYPDKTSNELSDADGRSNALVHETGHTWSYRTWGRDTTKGKWAEWKQAMDADVVSVSGYATASIAEDVAETVRTYVSAKATPRQDEYKRIVPHRFAILATEYDK